MSQVHYFSEWQKGVSCSGPPTSMYVIDANDVGPESFQWKKSQLSTPGVCGLSLLPLDSGCCIGSLNVNGSKSESSMSTFFPQQKSEATQAQWTPASALGAHYCAITTTSAAGYPLTRYLLEDGVCRERLRCLDGIMTVSRTTTQCPGDYPEILDGTMFSEFLNTTVFVEAVTINNASQIQKWNGYYPYSVLLNLDYLPIT